MSSSRGFKAGSTAPRNSNGWLLLHLDRLAAGARDVDVREGRVSGRAVPVLLTSREVDDIARRDHRLLRLRGHDALAGGYSEALKAVWITSCVSKTLGPANISLGGRSAWARRKSSLSVQVTKASSFSQ